MSDTPETVPEGTTISVVAPPTQGPFAAILGMSIRAKVTLGVITVLICLCLGSCIYGCLGRRPRYEKYVTKLAEMQKDLLIKAAMAEFDQLDNAAKTKALEDVEAFVEMSEETIKDASKKIDKGDRKLIESASDRLFK